LTYSTIKLLFGTNNIRVFYTHMGSTGVVFVDSLANLRAFKRSVGSF